MYEILFENLQFPVAPEKLQMKISNQNQTMNLISGQEINIPKLPGLTEISFDLLLPTVQYPFAAYPDGFKPPAFYLAALEELKVRKKKFQFIVNRKLPGGQYSFDNNLTVLLEEYTLEEDVKDGFDVVVSIKLKQYNTYGTVIVTAVENTETGGSALVEKQRRSAKQPGKSYVVQRNDCLWNICKKELGDGSRYAEIARLNNIANPNEIYPGQVIRFA